MSPARCTTSSHDAQGEDQATAETCTPGARQPPPACPPLRETCNARFPALDRFDGSDEPYSALRVSCEGTYRRSRAAKGLDSIRSCGFGPMLGETVVLPYCQVSGGVGESDHDGRGARQKQYDKRRGGGQAAWRGRSRGPDLRYRTSRTVPTSTPKPRGRAAERCPLLNPRPLATRTQ